MERSLLRLDALDGFTFERAGGCSIVKHFLLDSVGAAPRHVGVRGRACVFMTSFLKCAVFPNENQ